MVFNRFISFTNRIKTCITRRVQFKCDPKYLGRWQLTNCPEKVASKIDWSNEDHCGPCGERIVQKASEQNRRT